MTDTSAPMGRYRRPVSPLHARKYSYKANFANAVTNIRLYLRNLMNEKRLVSRIKKFLVPIRPERSFERPIKPKSVKPFNNRTP